MSMYHNKGFTLIELMITVAIVGIIAAVGFPSYQNMVVGSHRGTAQSDLMALAATMERHYNANFTYTGAAEDAADTGNPAAFARHSPASEPFADRKYDLTIFAANNATYEIRAVPRAGTAQENDGFLSYSGNGVKSWDENNNNNIEAAERCWSC